MNQTICIKSIFFKLKIALFKGAHVSFIVRAKGYLLKTINKNRKIKGTDKKVKSSFALTLQCPCSGSSEESYEKHPLVFGEDGNHF